MFTSYLAIAVTSDHPQERKTIKTAKLGASFAQQKKGDYYI